jgi:hypothetical protein
MNLYFALYLSLHTNMSFVHSFLDWLLGCSRISPKSTGHGTAPLTDPPLPRTLSSQQWFMVSVFPAKQQNVFFDVPPLVVLRNRFRRLCKIAKCHYCLPRVCLSVCQSVLPSVRLEQLGSHWKDFRQILYLSIFRKSLEKIHVSLKSDKNNGYFKWKPIYTFDHTLLSFS